MREEAGISLEGESGAEAGQAGALAGLVGRTTGIGLGVATPGSVGEDKEDRIITSPTGPGSPRPGSLGKQSTINPNLAPGTAAGIAAGPAGDAAGPVDWDLWQSVVNDGPRAVARTSPEELNQAIANGIPQAIRGVIWQILAQSKNEELENVYRELVARRPGKDHAAMKSPQPSSTPTVNSTPVVNSSTPVVTANGKEKESVASSASSVHSDYSTPATTASNAALGSPSMANENPEDTAKDPAKLAAEKKQKDAALQKLEKTIKRDLGARTSYSKYLMAAGLQDGLFGICKAYALYDESVGYAQGMNFIAMPLLFNVSWLLQ
jgi:hypothetical protein